MKITYFFCRKFCYLSFLVILLCSSLKFHDFESVRAWIMAASVGQYQFKIVLLGEGCVGKTSLVLRYCQDKFNDKHLTTLQVRSFKYTLSI